MRGLIEALRFLTRLPLPGAPGPFHRCAKWFPLVGLVIGAFLEIALRLGEKVDPWLGALACLLVWAWITGALHLDGLADTADALGASHGNRERFIEILSDPHVGAFGAVSLVLQIASKLVLLMLVAKSPPEGLFLVPAWARWGTLVWGRLPTLKSGLGKSLFSGLDSRPAWLWGIALCAASLAFPALLAIPLFVLAWRGFLSRRGGVSGDLLGAGIEITESAGLLLLVLQIRI